MNDLENKNLRSEPKANLKRANKEWTDCIAKKFLGQWLNGANLTINEVCKDEYEKMIELDKEIYGEFPLKSEIA